MGCCNVNYTGILVEVSLKAPNIPMIITVSGTGTTRTVVLDVGSTGYYMIEYWLVDSQTDLQDPTLTPPTGDSTGRFRKATDSDGTLTITVTHEGAAKTWYLATMLIAKIGVSDALAYT